MKEKFKLSLLFFTLLFSFAGLRADEEMLDSWRGDTIQGLYKANLYHEGSKVYQVANITLKTIQSGGQLKVSAHLKLFFGDWNSTEFLSYEFDDVPYNFVSGQVSFKSEKSDVSMVGILKPTAGTIEGEWFSNSVGKVGAFTSLKDKEPQAPANGTLVKSLTGFYRGSLKNTNSQSNLPERVTLTFVTTQDAGVPKISGNTRLYFGEFNSSEYVETKLTDVQFNFYNRYLTAKTTDYGLTFKGNMSHEGVFTGVVFADGIGEAAKAELKPYP